MSDWEDYYSEDEERYRFEDMPEQVIAGLGDSYDDGRIDALIYEYLRLSKACDEHIGMVAP